MNDAPFSFTSHEVARDGVTVMKLVGPLTIGNIFELQKELRVVQPEALVFDLVDVPYMDSAGIGVLINYFVSAEKNARRMALAGANERVDALLVLTKVKGLLRSFETVDEAVDEV